MQSVFHLGITLHLGFYMFSHCNKDKITHRKPVQPLSVFRIRMVSPILAFIGAVILVVTLYATFQIARSSYKRKHRIALANFQLEVFNGVSGSGFVLPEGELEKRMRACLPRLEALARSAPRSDDGVTGMNLASWRTQLSMGNDMLPKPFNAWSQLLLAQRLVALGDAKDAAGLLAPLRKSAGPSEAWATVFWPTLVNIDQLQGNRIQGWKDLAEYKIRFKEQASPALEQMMAGV